MVNSQFDISVDRIINYFIRADEAMQTERSLSSNVQCVSSLFLSSLVHQPTRY